MSADAAKREMVLGVVGVGTMGRGIAQVGATGGMRVRLFDARPGAAAEGRNFIAKLLKNTVDKNRMAAAEAEAALDRLEPVEALSSLAESDLVIEAIVERLEAKQELFRQLGEIVRPDAILATNTSSLSVTAIFAGLANPERCAGFHFFNPVPRMMLVEVIAGMRTAPWVIESLTEVAHRMGRRPVLVADTPGFLVNHAGRGYMPEALRVLAQGVAGPADIDRIMKEAAGFRMGPFELMDLVGVDVALPAMTAIYEQYFHEPMYRPSALLGPRVAGGLLGRKSCAGFYAYADGQAQVPAEPSAPQARPAAVWISRDDEDGYRRVKDLVGRLGVAIDEVERPSPSSLCVVTPFGEDATSCAVRQGLSCQRVVAIDALFDLSRRRTVMVTPATTREARLEAHGLFAADGVPVTMIGDSAGFVAQRIVAMIVNVGAMIAEQRIAAPDDIDLAVRLGLNYPQGPLELGDTLGSRRVLAILEAMHGISGEPRYRPCMWLRRRALLGLSLRHPD